MKKIVIAITAIMATGDATDLAAQNAVPDRYIPVGGVGPAVAGSADVSSLPEKARKFIEKTALTVVSCEREFASGKYEVKLSTGLEIEFDAKGNVVELDAPDRCFLGDVLIRDVVPGRLYDKLGELKLRDRVSSIEMKKNGYKVEFDGSPYDEAVFNRHGDLTALRYED